MVPFLIRPFSTVFWLVVSRRALATGRLQAEVGVRAHTWASSAAAARLAVAGAGEDLARAVLEGRSRNDGDERGNGDDDGGEAHSGLRGWIDWVGGDRPHLRPRLYTRLRHNHSLASGYHRNAVRIVDIIPWRFLRVGHCGNGG
jgi:hypothetical protein